MLFTNAAMLGVALIMALALDQFFRRRLPPGPPRSPESRGEVFLLLCYWSIGHFLHDGELRPLAGHDGDDDAQDLFGALRYCVAGLRAQRDAVVGRRGGVARGFGRAPGEVRQKAARAFEVDVG